VLQRPEPDRHMIPADPHCAECSVTAIADAVPALRREIDQALAEQGLGRNGLQCFGKRLAAWPHLEGAESAPFYCKVGDRALLIDAPNGYRDETGRKIVWGEERWREKAVRFTFGTPRWRWTAGGKDGTWRE
jgi:hypothetical protein